MTAKLRSTCPHLEMAVGVFGAPICKACRANASTIILDLQADLLLERSARKLAIEALSEINRQVGKAFGGETK